MVTARQSTLIEIWTHGEHTLYTLNGATTATLRIDNGEYVRPQLRSLRAPLVHCKTTDEANQRAGLRAIERGLKYALDEWDHLRSTDIAEDQGSGISSAIHTQDELPPTRSSFTRSLELKVYTTSQYGHECMTHNAIRLDREHFWDAKDILLGNADVVKDILNTEKKLDSSCDVLKVSYHLVDEEQDIRAIRALRMAIPKRARRARGSEKKRPKGTRDMKGGKRKQCRVR